jgi:hypothetical protein
MLDLQSEAAAYAILCRVGPVLRHEVAGLMQPVRMLMTVLERRANNPETDRVATVDNINTINALTKEASSGCMNAFEWFAPPNHAAMNLRTGVDELKKLLALELSASALTVENAIPYDTAPVPKSFVRMVLIGALLAFSDSQPKPSILHIGIEGAALSLALVANDDLVSVSTTHVTPQARSLDWTDAEALAAAFGLATERGEGWFRIELPRTQNL